MLRGGWEGEGSGQGVGVERGEGTKIQLGKESLQKDRKGRSEGERVM